MLKFSLLGVPVTVHWSFVLVAFFGIQNYESVLEIAAWTGAVFTAVLLHESGHAFTARAYGASDVAVTVFALGGYTTWVPRPLMGHGKRFVVSAAGSAVGIAVGLVIWWLAYQGTFGGLPDWALAFFDTFILVALFWGVLNWIPLLPLDGGHMMNHALAIVWPKQAGTVALGVSTVVGVGLIGAALYYDQSFLAVFLIFILVSGWRSRPQTELEAPPQPSRPAGQYVQNPPEPAHPPVDREPPTFPI
jgi:Zn-dependent protease